MKFVKLIRNSWSKLNSNFNGLPQLAVAIVFTVFHNLRRIQTQGHGFTVFKTFKQVMYYIFLLMWTKPLLFSVNRNIFFHLLRSSVDCQFNLNPTIRIIRNTLKILHARAYVCILYLWFWTVKNEDEILILKYPCNSVRCF